MSFLDPQEAPAAGPQDADPKRRLVDQAVAYARSMRPGAAQALPQEAPRQTQDPAAAIAEWSKLRDPNYARSKMQDIWADPVTFTKGFAKTYRALPLDLQAREQGHFSENLKILNEIGTIRQVTRGISEGDAALSGAAAGFDEIFGVQTGLGSWLGEKLAGKFTQPITMVDDAGEEKPLNLPMTKMDALKYAAEGLHLVESMGVRDVYDPKAWSVMRTFGTMAEASGLARFAGELAATSGISKAVGVGLRGAQAGMKPGLFKSGIGAAATGAEFAGGQRLGKVGAFTGPFMAHGGATGTMRGLDTFETHLAEELSKDDRDISVEEKRKDLGGVGDRLTYALGEGATEAMKSGVHGLAFLGAHTLIRGAAGRAFMPKKLSGFQSEFQGAIKPIEPGYREALSKFYNEKGRNWRGASALLTRTATKAVDGALIFTAGVKGGEFASHLLWGEKPPSWNKDDLFATASVGAFWHAFFGGKARARPTDMKPGAEAMARFEEAKKGVVASMRPALDEIVANGGAKPEEVAELVEISRGFGEKARAAGQKLFETYAKVRTTAKGPEGERSFQMQGPPQAGAPAKDILGQEQAALGKERQAAEAAAEKGFQPPAVVEPGVETDAASPEARGVERFRRATGRGRGPITEEELGGYRATLDRLSEEADIARAAGDRRTADTMRAAKHLLERDTDLNAQEQGHLAQALKGVGEALQPKARGKRFADVRVNDARQDFTEDLEKVDRTIRNVKAATGQIPEVLMQRRDRLQRMLDMAEAGQMPAGYEPRPRGARAAEEPKRPAGTAYARQQAKEPEEEAAPAGAPRGIPKGTLAKDREPTEDGRRANARHDYEVRKQKEAAAAAGEAPPRETGAPSDLRATPAAEAPPDAKGEPTKSVADKDELERQMASQAEDLAREGDYASAYAVVDELPPGDRKALAKKYIDTLRATEGALKKKEVGAPTSSEAELERAGRSADADVMPSEKGEAAPPEMRQSPARQNESAAMEAIVEIDKNPLAGGTADHLAGLRAGRDALIPTIRAPLSHRTGRDLIAAGGSTEGQGYSKRFGGGLSKEDPSRHNTSRSFVKLLRRIRKSAGVVTPDEVFDLASTIYAPPVPARLVAGFKRPNPFKQARERMVDVGGLIGPLKGPMSAAELADLVFDPATAARVKAAAAAGTPLDDAVHAAFMDAWSRARARFEKDIETMDVPRAPRAGTFMGSYFEAFTKTATDYLRWARAAEARGYNLHEPIGDKLKSPREVWLDALWNENWRLHSRGQADRQMADALGREFDKREYVVGPRRIQIGDFLERRGFDHLMRALEISNGVGTPEQLGERVAAAARLYGKTGTPRALEELAAWKMTPAEAKEIIEAWEARDFDKMEELGLITRKVVEQQAVGEKTKNTKLPEELKEFEDLVEDPEGDAFQSRLNEVEAREPDVLRNLTELTQGGGSAAAATRGGGVRAVEAKAGGELRTEGLASLSDPTEAHEAAQDLRRIPVDFINVGELVQAGELGKAELAFASGIEKGIWAGRAEVSTIDAIFRGDIATADRPLTAAASNFVRSIAKTLLSTARGHGWLVESDGRLRISDRMARLVLKVQAARGRNLDTRGKRKPSPTEGEGPDPTLWFCESPCRKKFDWEKPTLFAKRLWRMFADKRPHVFTALDMYARQIIKPETRRFLHDTVFAKIFGSQRNLFGDPTANLLSKAQNEALNLELKFVGGFYEGYKKHFPELPASMLDSPKWEQLSKEQQAAFIESVKVQDVLDGRPGATIEGLSERGKAAALELRSILHDGKVAISEHLFRDVRRAAEEAIEAGLPLPRVLQRRWDLVLKGITDPKLALEALKAITDPPAGTITEVGGQKFRSWGLEDYTPHMFGKSERVNDAFKHQEDPGQAWDADELVSREWTDGEKVEKWRAERVENYALTHGFIGNRKMMRNLLERDMNKQGYIRDLRWMPSYFRDLVEKITHERLADDFSAHVFGQWTSLESKDAASIIQDLKRVATESTHQKNAMLGSVEDHFGLKLTGKLASAGYRVLAGGGWTKPSSKEFGKDQRKLFAKKWRNDTWRIHSRSLRTFEGPEEWSRDATGKKIPGWTLELSNGSETLILYGKKAIEKAGVLVKRGGISNYREGGQYDALKDAVRKAFGYDLESAKKVGQGETSAIAETLKTVGDSISEFWYQTQLGGYLNPKAGIVQLMEGTLQNLSSVGVKPLAEAMRDMKGFAEWNHYVLSAKDPVKAALEADAKFAHLDYVKNVRPVMRESNTTITHLMRTHQASLDAASGKIQWAKRLSYMSFTLADVYTKEAAYYATVRQLRDAGEYRDPETGRVLKVIDKYIPVGDMFTRRDGRISTHDVARMVMERTHFTIPRWAQPGLVQMPWWPLVGHLGTQAMNITAEFWYSMGAAVKYAKTGDAIYQWQATKAGRYMAALAGAMILGRLLNRDIGAYAGSHISEIGFGKATLGAILPVTKSLPLWARVPAWQLPHEQSLPMKTLFSPDPDEGVPAMVGNAMLRWQSGEQGIPQAFGGAFKGWLNHNSRAAIFGPWSRTGRSVAAMLTAERTDLDPERPYSVRDPWMFGPDGRTRLRDGFELYFADLFLPGWSYKDSAEHHRAQWQTELHSVRGMVGADLRKHLRSQDPEVVRAAKRELLDRGHKVESWRQRKAGILDALPGYARQTIGEEGDRPTKLKNFASMAAGWAPNVRRLALRWILPEKQKFDPSSLPEGLWAEVQSALNAPSK